MNRMTRAALIAMLSTSCVACDPPQTGELDSFHMRIDGELVEFQVGSELAAGLEQASLLTLDGLVAFDDREAKRYDDAVDIGLFGGEDGRFLFVFSMPAQLGTGGTGAAELLVSRTQLPRAAEAHVRFERIDDDGARTTFRPGDPLNAFNEQPIQVTLSEDDDRLLLSFDRLELRDDCDNPLLIEDARIEARMRTTTSFEDMPRFAALGIDARQVEGITSLRLDDPDAPFNDLAPRTEAPRDGSTHYQVALVNACKTAPYSTITFAFDSATETTPGVYDFALLNVVAYRNRGDPERIDDDDQFTPNGGLIELIAVDEFLEFYALTPLELDLVGVDGEPVLDSSQDLFLGDNTYVKSFINR